ncbi:HNH endonuclease, partial [Streptosporangiaceae bacterium NEAU-GS5]|nr:HNH endonuclease [Streptosporangiaceae bacterium NEAU-GS5]
YVRYATCITEGCPIPAHLCQIDHIDPWASGGRTDLDRLAPCCGFHNRDRAIHPQRYRIRRTDDGRWALTYLGLHPQRAPR